MHQLPSDHIAFDKYLSGSATPEEIEAVEAWYQSCQNSPSLTEGLSRNEMEKISTKMWNVISSTVSKEQNQTTNSCH